MTKLGFALVAIVALMVFAVPSAFADKYCVITNPYGNVGVTDGIPSNDWSLVSSSECYSNIDAAQRAAGVGTGGPLAYEPVFADASPRGPGRPFVVESLP